MELVFATNNPNKLKEIQQILGQTFQIKGLKEIGCTEDIAETESTLEGNARIKSQHVWNTYGKNCFSDDTGLEVEALNGEPGVYSARYAGEDCNAEDNMRKLLAELGDQLNRKARFRTAISLIVNGKEWIFEGIVEGRIALNKLGEDGFGYDPIFIPEDENRSFAQMSSIEKNKVSHRGRAVQKLVDFLKENSIG